MHLRQPFVLSQNDYATVRFYNFLERVSSLPNSTADRSLCPAMVWRRSVDLDHVHVVLSASAACRLCVLAFAERETNRSVTGRDTYRHVGSIAFVSSDHSFQCLETDCRPITFLADSVAAIGDRGRPLLYALNDRAVAATVVQLHFASRVSLPFVRALQRRLAISVAELSVLL